ncbi:hypothetical protein D3C75_1000610 [compost metagenome]
MVIKTSTASWGLIFRNSVGVEFFLTVDTDLPFLLGALKYTISASMGKRLAIGNIVPDWQQQSPPGAEG